VWAGVGMADGGPAGGGAVAGGAGKPAACEGPAALEDKGSGSSTELLVKSRHGWKSAAPAIRTARATAKSTPTSMRRPANPMFQG
jgi:hypothetical protein